MFVNGIGTESWMKFDKGFAMVNSERLSFGKEPYVPHHKQDKFYVKDPHNSKWKYCYLNFSMRPLQYIGTCLQTMMHCKSNSNNDVGGIDESLLIGLEVI